MAECSSDRIFVALSTDVWDCLVNGFNVNLTLLVVANGIILIEWNNIWLEDPILKLFKIAEFYSL
jgi:hypothetical protein